MEVLTKVIKHGRPDVFRIHAIGDVHAGSIHCAEDEIRAEVELVAKDPSALWVGMGDYADCITKNDKRFDGGGLAPWVQHDDIIEAQRKYLVELFKPIAPKCLAFLTGNHEEAIHLAHNDDIGRHLADDLGVPYAGYSAFIELLFKRGGNRGARGHTWRLLIHAWHGAGASQTEGARVMRLMRLVNDIEADIYMMGHLHAIAVYSPDRLYLHQGQRIRSTKLAAVCTGSWLKTYGQPDVGERGNISYGEMKGYKPSRIGCPIIEVYPDKTSFKVLV